MARARIDPYLRKTLRDFVKSYGAKREAAFRGLDVEDLRERLKDLRDRVIRENAELVRRFEAEAAARGVRVLRARDGDEANRAVLSILRDHGVRTVVKAKSMVSEETRLNAFLTGNGVRPRETDLGEWIVQLAGEAPTHMVMPAIHLDRAGVAKVFSEALGREVPPEIPGLVRIAREEFRREVFDAGAGLTGANALVAESGAAMLVTNEGNGRLCATVPPVHIVLASLEKVVPTVADALLQLRLLTRNATGQTVTSYVSFMSGEHGKARYVVLVDNHRSELMADASFRETMRCVKCSACLNVCPVYAMVGGKEFSHIYMGGIGSLLTAWIHGLRESKGLAALCMGCHRCESVCATKIPIADLIVRLKGRLADETGRKVWKRVALDGVMGRPAVQKTLFAAGRAAGPVIRKDGFARRLPLGMSRYDRFRALPTPAKRTLTALFRKEAGGRTMAPAESAAAKETARGEAAAKTVTLFPGCLVQHVYPEAGVAAAKVLAALGYEVALGPSSCCGFPHMNSGHRKSARRALGRARRRMEGAGDVVTLCPTCATMLERGLDEAPEAGADAGTGAAERGPRVTTFSKFLAEREGPALDRALAAVPRAPAVVWTYHDSCHHKHVLKAAGSSRAVLAAALGGPALEMEDADGCCGFAGVFCAEQPAVSEALTTDKVDAIAATGAGLVALDCPGCLLQVRGGCARRGLAVEVRHTAEVLAERLALKS